MQILPGFSERKMWQMQKISIFSSADKRWQIYLATIGAEAETTPRLFSAVNTS